MNWNYIGIDGKPPKRVPLLVLLSSGHTCLSDSNNPNMIAWLPVPEADKIKQRCQIILRGLPELAMIACVLSNPVTRGELGTALDNYWDEDLSAFVDMVRVLDRTAHNITLGLQHHV